MELLKFLGASLYLVLGVTTGYAILGYLKTKFNPTFQFGLGGIIGLGLWGTVIGLISMIPGAVSGFLGFMPLIFSAGTLAIWFRYRSKEKTEQATPNPLLVLALAILLALPIIGVVTPSTSLDWDSLAYHLALPKLWTAQGHSGPVSFIHHSNFPGAVDSWFIAGELLGGQTGAKTVVWLFTVCGAIAVAGFLKERFSSTTSWLGAIAFASIPMVMWESGTAYIDVANGLFAGFGFVFAAQYAAEKNKSDLWLAAILLSLAAGSKYTGLQAIAIASLVVLLLIDQREKASSVKLGALAFAFASPWYIKNWIMVGNPVYPFFYGVLGGKNWDAFQGQIYTEEQKTFGYQGALNLGQSIFGIVTSPGRFTNPGPTAGTGFAFVSIGLAVVVGAVVGIVRGLTSKFDKALALMILLQLVAWFVLSQQSRYILTLVVPMLYFTARGLEWKPLGKLVAGAIAVQALATLWLYKESIVAERLPVLVGGLSADEFLGGFKLEDGTQVPGKVDTYSLSKVIDADPNVQKVALFDEVFGYYLNKLYFWATPGHTTEMGYAEMQTADEFVAALKKLGNTHVYLTNKYLKANPNEFELWMRVSGIGGTPGQYSPEERQARMGDQRSKWRVLLAEAVAAKKLTLHTQFSSTRFLFKIE